MALGISYVATTYNLVRYFSVIRLVYMLADFIIFIIVSLVLILNVYLISIQRHILHIIMNLLLTFLIPVLYIARIWASHKRLGILTTSLVFTDVNCIDICSPLKISRHQSVLQRWLASKRLRHLSDISVVLICWFTVMSWPNYHTTSWVIAWFIT